MAGYIGKQAVVLSTTAADVNGNADIDGTVTADRFDVEGSGVLLKAGAVSSVDRDVLTLGWVGGVGDYIQLNVPSADDESGTVRFGSNGNVYFYEDTGSDVKFKWDASAERLGIGTSSPSATLDVDGTIKLDGNYPDGTNNVALGDTALDAVTGTANTAIGRASMTSNTSGSSNTAVGADSLRTNATGASNTAVGKDALYANTANNNTAVGADALTANTSGGSNVAVGYESLKSTTSASGQTAVGYQSLKNATGGNNTAIGYEASVANTTGYNNVAVGLQSLKSSTTANNNVSMGAYSMYATTTGSNNVSIGRSALYDSTTCSYVTAVGRSAGVNVTTGSHNTFVGGDCGATLTTGSGNTFIGQSSGYHMTTGSDNTILGRYNGNQGGLDIRTSNNNVVLSDGDGNPRQYIKGNGSSFWSGSGGNFWDGAFDTSDTNVTGVGIHIGGSMSVQMDANSAGTEVINVNNIFSTGATCSILQYRTRNTTEGSILANGSGLSFSNVSDYRKKENIADLTGCLDTITSLRPVSYNFRSEYTTDTSEVHKGFIAHEVADHMPNLVNGEKDAVDSDGNIEFQSVMYTHNEMIATLVGAIKEQKEIIEALETRIETLESA